MSHLKCNHLSKFFNEFVNFSKSLNNLHHKDALSLLHIITCSLPKNIEELEYPLDKTKIEFNVIGISELRIKKIA